MKMMKAIFLAVLLAPGVLLAQNPTQSVDITPLKNQLAAQQKLLDQQAQQIKALQSALAEQKKTLDSLSQGGAPAAALQESVTELKQQVSTVAAQEGQVSNPPLSPAAQQEEEELQRGPEIADVLPDTPAIPVGPAKLRIIGYPALTGVFRSNNSGGNVGTSFGSIPYTNTAPGNASEFRLSAQSTRLALRVDAPLQNNQTVAGYFEMDFGGSPNAGNIAVTSTSYTFRIRQAWFEYAKDKFSFDAGQLFTLMTPLKKGITPWPGDVATTQVVDTNYVAGTVVGRYPQFRMVYRASKDVNLGFSIENPEQQVGSNVVFPSGLASILNTQYNIGTNELKVPNMTPDFVFKFSSDSKIGSHAFHIDAGGLLRIFRNYAPNSSGGFGSHDYEVGGGGNVNATLNFTPKVRFLIQTYGSSGGGRYIGGLQPDVVVQSNGDITPIPAYSWTTGFEIAPNKSTGWYIYYSGNYADRETVLDTTVTPNVFVGFGYPGAKNGADRYMQEATGGYSRVFWKAENLGSIQMGIQYGYVWIEPWVQGSGPNQANASMVFVQTRYNLP